MKKSIVLICLMVLIAGFAVAYDVPTSSATYGTAKVDGEMDKAYENSPWIELKNVSWGQKTDVTAKAKICWDSKNVYIYCEITDDKVTGHVRQKLWEQDCFEVFIDEGNLKKQTYQKNNDFQYVVSWTGRKMCLQRADFEAAHKIVSGRGWNGEMAIPFRNGKKRKGDVIGIEISVDDSDSKRSGRKGQISWSQKENLAWTKPAVFGNIVLK